MFNLTRQEQLIVLLLTTGLIIGSIVLIVRGRPAPAAGEPLDFTVELPAGDGVKLENVIGLKTDRLVPDKMNINTATAHELESLPGIGPVLAGRIVEYREENGRFNDTREILEVSGIGERKYGDIEGLITVE
ncbi:MAG: helix-hairpin-helix domain-containing protein [Candidatus Coatesbacteria bacterium]|nr:MAG: helix-hairpin-helix domain-containing protein [Candidatus Coatesbacteria bacterium]